MHVKFILGGKLKLDSEIQIPLLLVRAGQAFYFREAFFNMVIFLPNFFSWIVRSYDRGASTVATDRPKRTEASSRMPTLKSKE